MSIGPQARPTAAAIARSALLALALLTCVSPSLALDPFVPNDPYFTTGNPAGSLGQWNLDKQTSGALVDINVKPAWDAGLTGAGVTVDIIDGGIDYTHPDLAPNYVGGWDYIDNDSSPLPGSTSDRHGTAVAGIAAAEGGNGIGITGVAPDLKFRAKRYMPNSGSFALSDTTTVNNFAAAIRSNAAPMTIKNVSSSENDAFGAMRYTAVAALEQAAIDATAAGSIIVTSAGNGRLKHGVTSGYDADAGRKYFSHITGITVTALNSQGVHSEYSGWGSCVTACVPSGDTVMRGGAGILTTDLRGSSGYNPSSVDAFPNQDYTSVFTGGSAAAPTMCGILALGMQSHHEAFGDNLVGADNTRYYKHLLAETCKKVDVASSTWTTNSAGHHFSNDYGFGVADTGALVQAAAQYRGATPLETFSSGDISVNSTVPANNTTGITRSCTISADPGAELEGVCVRLKMDGGVGYAAEYGILQGLLTSPDGTESLLIRSNPLASIVSDPNTYSDMNLDWTFTSNAFWGEDPNGSWTFKVSCPNSSSWGDFRWSSFEITTYCGELIPVPEPGTLSLLGAGVLALCGVTAIRRRKNSK